MRAASLEVRDLVAGHGATRVVDGVSFRVEPGQRLAVLGRNGVGKTTLLAGLVGHARHHAGLLLLGEVNVTSRSTEDRARLGLGYVPQTRDVFASLTVEENLFVGLNGRPRAGIEEAYTLFPRLGERRSSLARLFSGGEQQMLSTARAILGQPTVLLLDEPLEGLAPVICDLLMAALVQLAACGRMTVVLVEQQVDRALAFADVALLMERGRIAWAGPAIDLAGRPDLVHRHVGIRH